MNSIQIRLPEEQLKLIDEKIKRGSGRYRSRSDVIRYAVWEFLYADKRDVIRARQAVPAGTEEDIS